MAWRYLAQRLTGDGKGEFIDMNLPLSGTSIEDALSGPGRLTATIDPEYARLKAEDGRPLLEEWATAIYAEKDGQIRSGGILVNSGFDGPNWSLDCMGFAGYAQGMPYTGADFFVGADPADIFRHIWNHLQSQPGGDLGLVVEATTTPVRIGVELRQVEFDTQEGPISFEAGPYKLAWYQTDDLGRAMDDLAAQTPFEYRERHVWNGNAIDHLLEIGYPTLGQRRTDLRFVVGENVSQIPSVERDGEDFANEILALGAGEGRDMIRASDSRTDGRLRRVAVVADKTARTVESAQSFARSELAIRGMVDSVTEIAVRNHPHAEVGSWNVGDEIRVQGRLGWVDVDAWCRVISSTVSPDSPDIARISILRSDTLAA